MRKTVYGETIMLRQTVTLATAILSSQSFCDSRNNYLSLSPSSAPQLSLSVCPAIKAYISVTMGWILIKLGGDVGT